MAVMLKPHYSDDKYFRLGENAVLVVAVRLGEVRHSHCGAYLLHIRMSPYFAKGIEVGLLLCNQLLALPMGNPNLISRLPPSGSALGAVLIASSTHGIKAFHIQELDTTALNYLIDIYSSMGSTTTQTITAENVIRLFPDVDTHLATSHRVPASDHDLQGYDEEQIRLMEEVCIVLDENDVPIGSASKKVCTCDRDLLPKSSLTGDQAIS